MRDAEIAQQHTEGLKEQLQKGVRVCVCMCACVCACACAHVCMYAFV